MKKRGFSAAAAAVLFHIFSCAFAAYIVFVMYPQNPIKPAHSMKERNEPAKSASSASIQDTAARQDASKNPSSLKLIDISHHDKVTDWKKVADSVDGIYIKATEGTTITDPELADNAQNACKTNMTKGFYHYFWPGENTLNAQQQANYFYSRIKDYDSRLYPVIDVEETGGQDAKTICADVKAFADEFKWLSGKNIMVYCSPLFANKYLTDKSLDQYPLWVASYNTTSPGPASVWSKNYTVWQYGTTLKVDGIAQPVDGDIATSGALIDSGGGNPGPVPLSREN